ncbi:hypothetical protein PR202_ga11335 [Eleusine coracana subsp. coracana]|uniref:BZIP domain-containing protein n=1 Tax=Eleusine coracana subsp. coracana TaxID=191504 RepID=A0AAV5C975_ELECO|nr:hypothetical protein PR202_ga11335 [Eleusine coracana subsp. coracana]
MAATYLSQIEYNFCELFREYSLQAVDSQSKNAESDVKDVVTIDNGDPWADWREVQNVQQMKTTSELEEYLSEETVPRMYKLNLSSNGSCVVRSVADLRRKRNRTAQRRLASDVRRKQNSLEQNSAFAATCGAREEIAAACGTPHQPASDVAADAARGEGSRIPPRL